MFASIEQFSYKFNSFISAKTLKIVKKTLKTNISVCFFIKTNKDNEKLSKRLLQLVTCSCWLFALKNNKKTHK